MSEYMTKITKMPFLNNISAVDKPNRDKKTFLVLLHAYRITYKQNNNINTAVIDAP